MNEVKEIECQINMSGFKETNCNEIIEKGSNSLKKTTFAFKLQKNPSKVKIVLQGSVKQAFSNPEHRSPNAETTNDKLLTFTKKLKQNELITGFEEEKESNLCYTEPLWSSAPEDIYKMEVLKSGVLLNTLDLSTKNYHTIGRSLTCDVILTNETVSQFHAILQYKKFSDSENEKGMYIYDLCSTHGTFLNSNRIEPNKFILLHGGYMISFGNSERKYVLQTPKDNIEKEAELSAVELEELKRLESQEQERLEQEYLCKEKEKELKKEKDLKEINWGIADDDEISRMSESSENVESDNEELFLNDPQKALKDWFKWEGYDMEYQTQDMGFGRFSCSINLPLDMKGTMERVEATVTGDITKAVDKCALKACVILNKYGFLRQAYEEKKSTVKNWEEVNYYESDEDNFLDRTITIEKKRQQRMQVAGKSHFQNETHDTLMGKHSKIVDRIKHLENLIALQKAKQDKAEDSDEDALDSFMSQLDASILNKKEIRDIKIELHNLQQEKQLLLSRINLSESVNATSSKSCSLTIIEQTKNGCKFNT